MTACPSCAAQVPRGSRFCPGCGGAVPPSSVATTRTTPGAGDPPGPAGEHDETRVSPGAGSGASIQPPPDSGEVPRSAGHGLRSSAGFDQARFIPGTLIAGRYRIVGLLGKGGMGEVYRADDLKLGQPVALKFLPERVAANASWLERFYNEVRVAHQVSHPNVCRVHDIGEVEGHHYISMEYIDGEDLASLLRRIGRLPGDKAAELGRQICAGLAAAHQQGVLHRDLKPANVMIDGRGRARITDFGLAGLAEEIRGAEIRSGTPAYMAPEQLAGREVSVRSDLYALGLVLYELFTGKAVYDADTIEELSALQASGTPTSPADLVRDLDPTVERVILRCLEKEPTSRPDSALAVAAALPGGDPLAAALAAGETPSPEMVAAAGEVGALKPVLASLLFGLVIAGYVLAGVIAPAGTLLGMAPVEKPPEVLAERARETLQLLGYEDPPADSAYRYGLHGDYLQWIRREDTSPDRWRSLSSNRPPAFLFWYRESPRLLVPLDGDGIVSQNDPPHTVSGMTFLLTDTEGRLVHFRAVPPQVPGEQSSEPASIDWEPVFQRAGLDRDAFAETASEWIPPVHADSRIAWQGALPGGSESPIRIEAAGFAGRPVYFEVIGPWSRPSRMQAFQQRSGATIGNTLFVIFFAGVIGSGIVLARRNIRFGRGDRRGAFRIGVYVFGASMLSALLFAQHVPDLGTEFNLFVTVTGESLFIAGFIWLMYLALEPLVRRRWPEGVIAWTRLLSGRLRDPLVGREILVGALLGVLFLLAERLYRVSPAWLSMPPPLPMLENMTSLLGPVSAVAGALTQQMNAIFLSMILMFFFFIGVIHKKNIWYSLIFFGFYGLMDYLFMGGEPWYLRLGAAAIRSGLVTFAFYRFGLLAAVMLHAVGDWRVPISLDFSAWYTGTVLFPLVLMLILIGFAFYNSLGGRPLTGGTPTPART